MNGPSPGAGQPPGGRQPDSPHGPAEPSGLKVQLQPIPAGQLRDFGELAKRLRGRTLDLLAIGLLGAIIVGIGRQAVEWWAIDPVAPSSQESVGSAIPLLPLFGAGGQPVTIEFGRRQARLTRRTFQGSRESAVEQLAVVCLERTLAATVPQHPPDRAEQALLTALSQHQPWDSQPQHWRVYITEGPVSLAVGLRWAGKPDDATPSSTSGSAAASGWRVATNAFAFPADRQQRWTIYETEPLNSEGEGVASPSPAGTPRGQSAAANPSFAALRDKLLPQSIIPLISLTAADGSCVTSFRAAVPRSGSLEQLRLQFERAAGQAGGVPLLRWTAEGDTDRAAWQLTSAAETYRWEVQLRPDPAGTGIAGWASLLKAGTGTEPPLSGDTAQ